MRLITLVAVLALTGCVPKKKYDESMLAFAQLTEERDALEAERARLEAELASTQAECTATEARLAAELEAARTEVEETRARLVAAMDDAGALEADIASMREALAELEERRRQSEAALADYRDLVSRFQALIDAGTLRVKFVDGRMLVELATDILFDPGSAQVSDEGSEALGQVAGILASIDERQYQVAGHTDNVPINTTRFPSNWQLGSARATAVLDILVSGGLSRDRVSAASYADTKPVATNETTEGKAQNRRIEIVVVPDLSTLPGYDELSAMGAE